MIRFRREFHEKHKIITLERVSKRINNISFFAAIQRYDFRFFAKLSPEIEGNVGIQRYDLAFPHTFGNLELQIPCARHKTWT